MAKRVGVTVGPWHEKLLILWADCKGISKTALATSALQTKIEENDAQIMRMLEDRARDLGISPQELTDRILHGSGYEPERTDHRP
jgi:hypothetical protein